MVVNKNQAENYPWLNIVWWIVFALSLFILVVLSVLVLLRLNQLNSKSTYPLFVLPHRLTTTLIRGTFLLCLLRLLLSASHQVFQALLYNPTLTQYFGLDLASSGLSLAAFYTPLSLALAVQSLNLVLYVKAPASAPQKYTPLN